MVIFRFEGWYFVLNSKRNRKPVQRPTNGFVSVKGVMEEPKRSHQLLRLQNASLRSPRSYPECMSPAGSLICRDTYNAKGDSIEKIRTEVPDSRMPPSKLQKLRLLSKTPLCLDGDVSLFQNLEPLSPPKSCHYCGLYGSRRCSSCRITYYCSVECQKKDWSDHSVLCKPASAKDKVSCTSPTETTARKSPTEGSPGANPMNIPDKKIMWSDLKSSDIKEDVVFEGIVVDFSNPCHFYSQAYSKQSVESLLKLSTNLNKIYRNPENLKKGYVPAIGEVCVAKYSRDQHWYRVMVQNIEVGMRTAQVLYLDYGNQEAVPLDDLQQMHQDLELFPPTALKCSLANIMAPSCGWSPECLVEVRKLLLEQQLSFTVVYVEEDIMPSYAVNISIVSSGVNVSKLLLDRGYAMLVKSKSPDKLQNHAQPVPLLETLSKDTDNPEKPCNGSEPPQLAQTFNIIAVSVGDVFNAAITDIQSPEDFFCQQLQNAKQLAELMDTMSKHCKGKVASPGFAPGVGDMCCAQFTEDNRWYRASIVKYTSNDSVLVGYVDFGNVEVLPVSRLRPVLPNMMAFPLQAIKCSLSGVMPPSETWTKEATTAMLALVANKIVTVKVVAQTEFSLIVDLLDASVNPEVVISKCLIEAGVAVKKEDANLTSPGKTDDVLPGKCLELPMGLGVEIIICMLQSPAEFYCQICNEKDLKSLNEVNLQLNQYCMKHQPLGYNSKTGDLCCAFFSADKNWYRARVTKVSKTGKTKVCFLDYGNREEVTADQICQIPSQFLELPFQAIRCSLAGVKPIGDQWTRATNETFQMCVAGHKLQAKAVHKTEDGYSVDLIDLESSRSISDVLIAQKAAVGRDAKNGLSAITNHSLPKTNQEKTSFQPFTPSNSGSPRGRQEALEKNSSNHSASTTFKPSSPKEKNTRMKSLNKECVPTNTMCTKQPKEDIHVNYEWNSIELPLNEALQASVISVVSPDLFYVMPKEIRVGEKKLQKVLVDLAGSCNAQATREAFKPSAGDLCCAKFRADGQWYRALVLETLESAAKVVYADYGNMEFLPFSSLLPIRKMFLETPVHIVKCSLTGVTPISEEWSPASTELLKTLVQEKVVTLTALQVNGGLYSVSVEQPHMTGILNVSEKLISDGLARSSSTLSPSPGTCKSADCCCREVLKRVERLEQIFKLLLQQEIPK
uniref:Tudor domain containing 1 n=1 Tax=Leptobrachium leishanense TaxID=445787 RepID=A0A8C5Q4P6_9ANUR